MPANDTQVGGTHWINKRIQCWDYIIAQRLDFVEGSIIKYVTRWKEKNGIEDLKKARHFIDKLIEVAEAQKTVDAGK